MTIIFTILSMSTSSIGTDRIGKEADSMRRSIAEVETASANRYMVQMCKHFAHKIPAEYSEKAGSIKFEAGTCRLVAGDTALMLECEAADEERLDRVQNVVVKHLERFAFRENLVFDWSSAEG